MHVINDFGLKLFRSVLIPHTLSSNTLNKVTVFVCMCVCVCVCGEEG